MNKLVLMICLFFLISYTAFAQVKNQPDEGNTDEWAGVRVKDRYPHTHVEEWEKMHVSKSKSIDWFRNAKYGMFIHFGAYSTTGGIWNGKKMEDWKRSRHVEWLMLSAKISRSEYEGLFPRFNPVKFNAKEIVKLAKDAGMKYIVITSKHHDGFALYDTKYSKYDVMDATPFKRDIIREMYDACKKEGMAFGVYYSHNIDWMEGSDSQLAEVIEKNIDIGYPNKNVCANDWDPSPNTFEEYLQNKAYPQVKELMINFPGMVCMWYDMPWRLKPEQSFNFYKIPYEIDPNLLISERIGHGFGDYYIPGDNEVPNASEEIQKPWETCGTINNSWAFKSYDEDWKSPKEILYWLVDIVSKGGNYLLNIGPDGDGIVPVPAAENLRMVGKWLAINGEAIYNTQRWKIVREGPIEEFNVKGTADRAEKGFQDKFTPEDFWFTQKNNLIYAICLAKPEREISVKAFGNSIGKIKKIELLGKGSVKFIQSENGVKVRIPKSFKAENGFVIKVIL